MSGIRLDEVRGVQGCRRCGATLARAQIYPICTQCEACPICTGTGIDAVKVPAQPCADCKGKGWRKKGSLK